MWKTGKVAAASFAALFCAALAAAQHEGHQMPGMSGGAAGGACVEHSRQSLEIIERANGRLEEARQSNNPVKMRAAMDDFQGVLGELKTHQTLCAQSSAPGMEQGRGGMGGPAGGVGAMDHSKMGQTMSAAPPAGPKAMDHSKMGQPPKVAAKPAPTAAPTTAIDPVCGMEVQKKSAPRVNYQGQTYYFCSGEDKERFEKETRKYLKQ